MAHSACHTDVMGLERWMGGEQLWETGLTLGQKWHGQGKWGRSHVWLEGSKSSSRRRTLGTPDGHCGCKAGEAHVGVRRADKPISQNLTLLIHEGERS